MFIFFESWKVVVRLRVVNVFGLTNVPYKINFEHQSKKNEQIRKKPKEKALVVRVRRWTVKLLEPEQVQRGLVVDLGADGKIRAML